MITKTWEIADRPTAVVVVSATDVGVAAAVVVALAAAVVAVPGVAAWDADEEQADTAASAPTAPRMARRRTAGDTRPLRSRQPHFAQEAYMANPFSYEASVSSSPVPRPASAPRSSTCSPSWAPRTSPCST